MNWQSIITFGKYKGETILSAWITDKAYFKWCVDEGVEREEIDFLVENTKPREWPR